MDPLRAHIETWWMNANPIDREFILKVAGIRNPIAAKKSSKREFDNLPLGVDATVLAAFKSGLLQL